MDAHDLQSFFDSNRLGCRTRNCISREPTHNVPVGRCVRRHRSTPSQSDEPVTGSIIPMRSAVLEDMGQACSAGL